MIKIKIKLYDNILIIYIILINSIILIFKEIKFYYQWVNLMINILIKYILIY